MSSFWKIFGEKGFEYCFFLFMGSHFQICIILKHFIVSVCPCRLRLPSPMIVFSSLIFSSIDPSNLLNTKKLFLSCVVFVSSIIFLCPSFYSSWSLPTFPPVRIHSLFCIRKQTGFKQMIATKHKI